MLSSVCVWGGGGVPYMRMAGVPYVNAGALEHPRRGSNLSILLSFSQLVYIHTIDDTDCRLFDALFL